MNLITFGKNVKSNGQWKTFADFREMDHSKLKVVLQNMLANVQELLGTGFKYDINISSYTSDYLAEKPTYYDNYAVTIEFGEHKNTIKFFYPKLMYGNYFIMYGALYIPLTFLERAPIDVFQSSKAKKITVNILPSFIFSFDFTKNSVLIKKRSVHSGTFMRALFEENKYYDSLVTAGIVPKCEQKTLTEAKALVFKTMGFYTTEYFESNPDLTVAELFDKYLILDYFKGMFKDYYGVDNIKDIVKKVVEFQTQEGVMEMASLDNRRIVMNEYLIKAIYEWYIRLVYSAIDRREGQAFIPTLNANVITTSGFRDNMHAGNFFNNGLPYTLPMINKISQDISIIKSDKLPKSWTSNHPSALGKICPISVSAQNMGSNVVATSNARINYYGRFEK